MQIVVLGLGRFGMELARTLASQGHEVLAVDQSEPEVQRLADEVAKAAIADITDEAALRELGVAAMDVGVVATAMVEASVLAVMNLQALGVPVVYAKAQAERHATILRRLGAQRVAQPEKEGGERFAHLIRMRGAQDYMTLTADYGIGVYGAHPSLVGRRLEELDTQAGTRRLLMVVRNEQVQLNPVRSQVIEGADLLVYAGTDEDLAQDL